MRIALIAMSGIRVHNPILSQIGLTLPGFAERGKAIASLPSLSLLTLAALTPERHEVEYVEVADIRDIGELPECDLAAFSSYTAQVKDAYQLADLYRAEGVPTVIGGLHVSCLPDEALEHCDAVVVGEGEPAWPRVVADMEAGRLAGVYSSDGIAYDLADAPIPRFDLLDPERYNRLTVQTQRGCPWHCEFCASSILLTSRYKQKPVPRVIAEIEAIKAIWTDEPFLELADDNTFVNKHYGRELAEAMGGLGLRWFTETDVSVADDLELLRLLKEAGCRELLIGLESPTKQGLEGLELKHNWKRKQIDGYYRAIEIIQSNGIAVNACFVLGLDGDGPEVFEAIEQFVEKTLPFDVQITALTPFPGTPLYERLLAEGRILEPGAWERCTLFDVNFEPKRMTVEDLEMQGLALGLRLYSKEATARRRQGFKTQLASGPIPTVGA
ncbi:MAG: radical SAM protein [Acidimicrobiia bacterium]|nr:radical SAM protein [Acidimicrobiia bacterium]